MCVSFCLCVCLILMCVSFCLCCCLIHVRVSFCVCLLLVCLFLSLYLPDFGVYLFLPLCISNARSLWLCRLTDTMISLSAKKTGESCTANSQCPYNGQCGDAGTGVCKCSTGFSSSADLTTCGQFPSLRGQQLVWRLTVVKRQNYYLHIITVMK